MLTLLIGNRLAASLLFFGLFFGISGALDVGVAAEEKTTLDDWRNEFENVPYSNNDKTQENASNSVGDIRTTVSEESVEDGALGRANEPLPLGRRALERLASENEERRRNETLERGVVPTPSLLAQGEAFAAKERDGELRVVRQNAYSGSVVFYELSNGLRILLKKTTERRVGIRVAARDVGTLGEREAAGSGLAALTASLVVESANEILRNGESDDCGARMRSRVGREGTVFALDVAAERFETALAATTDALWRSTFDAESVERSVRAARRRIETAANDRERLVDDLTAETVYVASPLREPLDGRLELLEETTTDDVRAFYASRLAPNRTVLAIAGPFDPERTLDAILANCRDVRRRAPLGTEPPTEPRQAGGRDAFVEAPGTTATLVLAWPTVVGADPDAAALETLAEILTGGANGRLTRKVVDGEIPAFDVAARSRLPFGVRGFFEIRSSVASDRWPVVEAAIRAELKRLAEDGPSEAETAAAKKRIETALAARDRDPVAALEARAEALAATGDPNFEARRREATRRVDSATIGRVVRERFGDAFNRVAILPKGAAPRLIVPERFEPSPPLLTAQGFANGLRVVAIDSADERLIDVRFVALAGALVETPKTAGLTALLAETLDKGSKRFSRSDVARFFDSIGARFEVEVGRDTISFGATVLKEDFDATFEILLDAATNPLFDKEEFERAKTRRLAALARRSESVDETLDDVFARSVPSGAAFPLPTTATSEAVASATLDDLRAFWEQIFSPQNLIVGFDGALEGTTATNAAFARLEAIPANPNFRPINFDRPNEPTQPIRRFKLTRGTNVGSALLAAPIPAASERADCAALTVLQAIWEGADGDGGRLAERFKDDFDDDCDFRVDLTPGPAPSYMTIRWTTSPESLPEASRRVLGTINEALESLISEEACDRAKRQIILRRKGRYVGLKEQTSRLILDEFYRVAPNTPLTEREREFEEAILRTTVADVARVARKYWERERAIWAIVSPKPFPGVGGASKLDDVRTTTPE
ncbi:MAG: insulinase family protein [Thermoguttaceae bacterium]|nr:insulinase family protein [Thermoguttaceae bacterium]